MSPINWLPWVKRTPCTIGARLCRFCLMLISTPKETQIRSRPSIGFSELGPRYLERPGGYTRVLKTRVRDGDNAQMAVIQFVEAEMPKRESSRRRRSVKRVSQEAVSKEEAVEVVADDSNES